MFKKRDKRKKRWIRWDNLLKEKKYIQLIKEFDEMVEKREYLTIGDLIKRDEALESIGVLSISPNALEKRDYERKKRRRRNF